MKPVPSTRDDLRAAAGRAIAADRSPCVEEERLVSFYAGSLTEPEADAIREHLAMCPHCVELGRDARRFLNAMSEPAPPRRRVWAGVMALAAAATIVACAIWVGRAWRGAEPAASPTTTAGGSHAPPVAPAGPWADLAIEKAAYAPAVSADDVVWRDEDAEAPSPDGFAVAMEPYRHDDFAEADRRLAAHLTRHPRDVRARFYRGVSLLLLERPAEARPLLEAAAQARGAAAHEARWYLARACLREGDETCAVRHLETLKASPARQAEAEALLRRVRDQVR